MSVCLPFPGVRGQGQSFLVDSLESRLEGAGGDVRREVLCQLVHPLSATDPQRAITYAREVLGNPAENNESCGPGDVWLGLAQAFISLELADSARTYVVKIEQQEDVEIEGRQAAAYAEVLGNYYRLIDATELAFEQYEIAYRAYEESSDVRGQASILLNVGQVYYRSGALESALDVYSESLGMFESIDDQTGRGKVLLQAGIVYDILGEYEAALSMFEQALALQELFADHVGAGITLCHIGIFYDLIGEYDSAIDFHNRSLDLCNRTKQNACQANALLNVADIQYARAQHRDAIQFFNEALAIYREIGHEQAEAKTLNRLGQVYNDVRDVGRALSSFADARVLYEALDEKEGLAMVQIDAGQLYRRQAHYEEALESLTLGLQIAEEIGAEPIKEKGYAELYLLHEGFGEYKEALAAHKKFKAASDSLISQESHAVLARLQTEFKSKEQKLRIQGLEQEKANQQRLLLLLMSGLLLLSGLAIFAYRLYRQKSQAHGNLTIMHQELKGAQQQLIHSEKMASLGQLTAGVAHEIRNPLNFIINFSKLNVELSEELIAEIQVENNRKVGDVASKFEAIIKDLSFNARKVNEHSHRAEGIVQSMLEHANSTRQERIPTSINEFVDEVVDLAFYGVNKNERACEIQVNRSLDASAGMYKLAPQELGRVLVNLIDNAIYAVCEKKKNLNGAYVPAIDVETLSNGSRVIIRLKDNGPGMSADVIRKIFEPFYSTKPTGKGTGLGLSLAYEIVTMSYGGEMHVNSKEGEGTTFEISLPR